MNSEHVIIRNAETEDLPVMETEIKDINEAIDNTENASNEDLANYIADKVKWDMCKDVLVKPLEPIMIQREFEVPVVTEQTSEEGETINEYESTKKEIREVESNFAKGVVLKMPESGNVEWAFKIGDTIIYNKRFSVEFDIFKDSVLVKPYDVIAVEK